MQTCTSIPANGSEMENEMIHRNPSSLMPVADFHSYPPAPLQRSFIPLVGVLLSAFIGCGETGPPPFRQATMFLAGTNTVPVSSAIAPRHQQDIANILAAMFGTPDEPFALPETGLDRRKLAMSAGPVRTNLGGVKQGLYRRHCAHCHGISGDGLGPTAAILNPYPRDYRAGKFKFKSTMLASPPTNEDLYRIIHDGIPGTAMPSFALLPPDEIAALVEYVKYLSIRGQMETALLSYVYDEGLEPDEPFDPSENPELKELLVNDLLAGVMESWHSATEQVIVPDESAIPPADRSPEQVAESVTKGRELYATRGECIKCHGPTGLGDGQQDDYDDWSKENKLFIDETRALATEVQELRQQLGQLQGEDRTAAQQDLDAKIQELAQRQLIADHLLAPRNAIPRNLREGIYRGGRRPIDLFWRIKGGIRGMPMPEAPTALTEEEIWQIVDYVQSLPFERINQPQRRPVNAEAVN